MCADTCSTLVAALSRACLAALCCGSDAAASTELPTLTVIEGGTSTSPRTSTATGFALLQLQRGQVAVTVEELSTAPDWQIKAYQCLKLLMPLYNQAVCPETLDFAVFRYYGSQDVSALTVGPCLVPSAWGCRVYRIRLVNTCVLGYVLGSCTSTICTDGMHCSGMHLG
jgi:hypothetical protein